MRQARELGATFSILGGDAMDNPEMVSIGGDSVEGFSYTSFAYSPNMPEKLMTTSRSSSRSSGARHIPTRTPRPSRDAATTPTCSSTTR